MPYKRIWVDADSCPAKARELIQRSAIASQTALTYVANQTIPFTMRSGLFSMQVCPATKDAADNYIADNCSQDELVITRDLPLAERLVARQVTVLNDRGVVFTKDILKKMLAERELSLQMQSLGIAPARWKSYNAKDVEQLALTLGRLLGGR